MWIIPLIGISGLCFAAALQFSLAAFGELSGESNRANGSARSDALMRGCLFLLGAMGSAALWLFRTELAQFLFVDLVAYINGAREVRSK